ncbi:MAG: alpha/beta hydrolase [Planctomycetes bacterium]|nr:alpha/beta hydrolase [Planctomycetota bacterium]
MTEAVSRPRGPVRWKRWAAIAAGALVSWLLAGLVAALVVTRPWNVRVDARATIAGCPVEAVSVLAADGVTGRGWLVRAAGAAKRCVVLAAGIRGNRLAMLPRAEWYLSSGWSVLLVDLRGTGASDPAAVSMGWNESLDLAAWCAFARTNGFAKVGAHGVSLGAAAVVYGAVRGSPPPAWDFAVLEACYRDIDGAIAGRLPWLPFAEWCTLPMAWFAGLATGARAADLWPVDAIGRLVCPTLFVCGTADREVGDRAAADLFSRSGSAAKELVEIPGAGHVDLWNVAGNTLRRALAAFLARQ